MSEEEIKQLKLERDTAIFVAKERLDEIERIKNQKEIFELRYLKADKEIERLNKQIEDIREERDYLYNTYSTENKWLYENLEKANNIINELEKWLENEIKRIGELQNPAKSKIKPYGEEYNNYTLIIGAYDNALYKLQELKGSDKE